MIVHLTTVHPRNDTRIRFRQLKALAENAYQCVLVVADGLGNEQAEGFLIQDLGRASGGRAGRWLLGSWRAWRHLRRMRPELVHFHDPELLPVGFLLRLQGCRVIYDVHENVPQQILEKYWLPGILRRPIACLASLLEYLGGRFFSAIVTATPKIAERFPPHKTVIVQNFPTLSELELPQTLPYAQRPPHFAYVGNITVIRGTREMIQAVGKLPSERGTHLWLAGKFAPQNLQKEVSALPGWERVNYMGWTDRKQTAELFAKSCAGLVLFHPVPNHIDAQPNKLFEYMAAGLPVIVSDFPLWRKIVGDGGCGLLVDPMDTRAIADAMQWMLDHPAEAEAMGRRGREAVVAKFNWNKEQEKLLALYTELLA
jgi:glycosyltransferase involved in cell wall biosynthesis